MGYAYVSNYNLANTGTLTDALADLDRVFVRLCCGFDSYLHDSMILSAPLDVNGKVLLVHYM